MATVELEELLSQLRDDVKEELASKPDVADKDDALDVDDLPIKSRTWHKVKDAVAVVSDLKNSTLLGTNKHAASTAAIYQAATGSVVKIYNRFDADFIAIQGDGAFALFWGADRYERAICTGITVKTFSIDLERKLYEKWEALPETGFKVGIGNSDLLVKRIGTPRNPNEQEPVWAGKAVNFATKSAQAANPGELVVTGGVWEAIGTNDYIVASCPCHGGPSLGIWDDFEIPKIPAGDADSTGRVLRSAWCETHGVEYCEAILEGKTKRDDVDQLRASITKRWQTAVLRRKKNNEERDLRNRRIGLAA